MYSCASDDEINNNKTSLVEMEFITTEPNSDKIMVSYYQHETKKFSLKSYSFIFDDEGDPLPLKITLENYKFNLINGEAFRENHSSAKLSVKLYVDGKLVLEDSSKGSAETFATVKFKYKIPE